MDIEGFVNAVRDHTRTRVEMLYEVDHLRDDRTYVLHLRITSEDAGDTKVYRSFVGDQTTIETVPTDFGYRQTLTCPFPDMLIVVHVDAHNTRLVIV